MKKIIIFATTVIATLSIMSFTVASEMERLMDSYEYASQDQRGVLVKVMERLMDSYEHASAFKSITVYKITMVGRNGAASTQSVQAEFDINSMELRVVEKRNGKNLTMTYSVVRNPYKGYSDDARGRYDYCADCYYW